MEGQPASRGIRAALLALLTGCAQGDSGGDSQGTSRDDAEGAAAAVRLSEPDAIHPQGFSVVSTVRELADGTVLVADPIGQALIRVDFASASADTVGGYGEGPAEYRQPDAVWPLPDGGTLLLDLGNGRLTELDAELEFGRTHPYSQGNPEDMTLMVVIPQGVDDRGRVYFSGVQGMGGESDSLPVLRLDMESGKLDTVAQYKPPGTNRSTTESGGRRNVRVTPVPLSPTDAWGVAPDGRVALVRAADYRLEWVADDGSVTSGSPIPYDLVAIGDAEKREWGDRRAEVGWGLSYRASIVDGGMKVVATRGGPRPPNEDLERYAWPDVMPAFHLGRVPVDPLGCAWVRRHAKAGGLTRYDLLGAAGERVETVELGVGRRVAGFGEGSIYVVQMDDLGLQRLERYALKFSKLRITKCKV